MSEMWKDIKGYEGIYQVSDLGRVKSLERLVKREDKDVLVRERILKPHLTKRKVTKVCLHKNGKQKTFNVHTLVTNSFLGERPEGYHVCHSDGDPSNNTLDNLRYDTISENRIDIYRYGKKHGTGKLCVGQVLEIRKLYNSEKCTVLELSKKYHVDTKAIYKIIKQESFKWLNDNGTIDESKTSVKIS